MAKGNFFSKIFLNPAKKARKYADELKNDCKLTNNGIIVTDCLGKPEKLSDTQKSFRSGYLQARKDSAKAYKANLKKGKK